MHQIKFLKGVFILKLKKKKKVVSGKTAFVATGPFFTDKADLYRNNALSILVLSAKNRFSSFSRKVFVFRKRYFKVNALRMFKTSSDCHTKICRSLKSLCKKQ